MAENGDSQEIVSVRDNPVSRIIKRLFGELTTTDTSESVVNVKVGRVVQRNPNRVHLTVINTSDSDVFLNFSVFVSATNGIRLTANGGLMMLKVDDDADTVLSEIYGVSTVDGKSLTIIETVIVSS